jgi:hypothetical protein
VAEGVRLGELDRAEQSNISGLLSRGFEQAVSHGIPFAERQHALNQQQAMEPLFRAQQAQQFRNLGLGPVGETATTEQVQKGSLFGDIAGAGLAVGGLLTNPASAAAAIPGVGARRAPQFAVPPTPGIIQPQIGRIDPALFRR